MSFRIDIYGCMFINCIQCKAKFYRRPSDMRPRNFCSHKCRGEYYTGKFRGENNPCWTGGPTASNRRERIRLREKRAELKQKGIEHLGGKCIECGYNKCIDGLDFHHPDPTKKDPDFSKKCETTWAKMKAKIKGCIVICCRCHRELHWNERQKIYEEEKKLARI